MAGVPGFEPGITIPKTDALPLGHTPAPRVYLAQAKRYGKRQLAISCKELPFLLRTCLMLPQINSQSLPKKAFYVMRHAQSVDNARAIVSGRSDPPLSQQGIDETLSLRALYQQLSPPPDRIIVSNKVRTHQTAQYLTGLDINNSKSLTDLMKGI